MRVVRRAAGMLVAGLMLALPGTAASAGPPGWQALSPGPAPTPTVSPGIASGSAVPTPGIRSELNGDMCVSASDCWGVGDYKETIGAYNETIHWTGKHAKLVAAPGPPGVPLNYTRQLNGVDCVSASDCWAVGSYANTSSATLNEALHWNGKKWKWVAIPQPGGTTSGANQQGLYGVECSSSSDCWAVGYYTNAKGADLNETLHWNGKKWKQVETPDPWGKTSGVQNVGYGVTCISSSDCWQAGWGYDSSASYVNQVWHWNGKHWTAPPVPQPSGTGADKYAYLEGIACPSASDCWATGGYYNAQGAYVNEALRWNGKHWKLVATPNPGHTASGDINYLLGMSCTSSSDCWTVGYYQGSSAYLNQGLRWNGKRWSSHAMPQPGGKLTGQQNELIDVYCATDSSCLAVGSESSGGPNSVNEALRWNGRAWKKN